MLGNRSWNDWIAQYSESHQNGVNRLCHTFGIPMIAICDTNSDPDLITVPIAGNDDAIRSVELITAAIADTIVEARREAPVREEGEDGESYTYSSDRGAEPASAEDRNAKKRRPLP